MRPRAEGVGPGLGESGVHDGGNGNGGVGTVGVGLLLGVEGWPLPGLSLPSRKQHVCAMLCDGSAAGHLLAWHGMACCWGLPHCMGMSIKALHSMAAAEKHGTHCVRLTMGSGHSSAL